MNRAKKKMIWVVILILLIVVLLVVILSKKLNDDGNSDEPQKDPPITQPSEEFKTEITRLKDKTTFFRVQGAVNDFYESLTSGDKVELFDMLEEDYKKENNITDSNVLTKFSDEYSSTSYMAKEIYYNFDSNITYYFINGYFMNTDMLGEDPIFINNVNYLIITDGRKMVIRPLEQNINMENYAYSYKLVEKKLNNKTLFRSSNINDQNVIALYVSNFLNLIYFNPRMAYEYLDDEMKKIYSSYDKFREDADNIRGRLSTNIFSYSKKDDNDIVIYNAKDKDQNKIKITEYYPMDYKINF